MKLFAVYSGMRIQFFFFICKSRDSNDKYKAFYNIRILWRYSIKGEYENTALRDKSVHDTILGQQIEQVNLKLFCFHSVVYIAPSSNAANNNCKHDQLAHFEEGTINSNISHCRNQDIEGICMELEMLSLPFSTFQTWHVFAIIIYFVLHSKSLLFTEFCSSHL